MTYTAELVARLKEKAARLDEMADGTSTEHNAWRLKGKAEGVRLAISFIEEERP